MRLRDELWWRLRDWLETRRCRLPKDDQLRDDLCAPRFSFTSDGKMVVESKDSMRRRGLPSCDHADALALTLAEHGMMVSSEGDSGLFDPVPVRGTIPGTEW